MLDRSKILYTTLKKPIRLGLINIIAIGYMLIYYYIIDLAKLQYI